MWPSASHSSQTTHALLSLSAWWGPGPKVILYVDIFWYFFFVGCDATMWARWWCICKRTCLSVLVLVSVCGLVCVSVCWRMCGCVRVCVWACGFAKMHPAVGCLHLTIKQLVRGAKSICNCCCCACVCVSLCECVQFLGMFQPVVARPNT